jgi:hypothetical protein
LSKLSSIAWQLLAVLLITSPALSAAEILFVATGSGGLSGTLYTVDPGTGASTPVGPIGYAVTGLAWDPGTSTLFGSTANNDATAPGSLITINTATGAGTVVGSYVLSSETMADLTFSGGVLYGWAEPNSDDLYTINTSTGAATVVGNSGLSTFGAGLGASPGGVLYFTGNGNEGELRTVDSTTSLTTIVAFLSGSSGNEGEAIKALAFNSAGTLYGVEGPSGGGGSAARLITINTSNGAMTTVGALPTATDALVFAGDEVSSGIPEPSTSLLLAPALLAIAALSRRLRQ